MNIYLVPLTESYGYNFDYFEIVQADSPEKAHEKLYNIFHNNIEENRLVEQNISSYELYECEDIYYEKIAHLLNKLYHKSQKHDILMKYYKLTPKMKF